MVHVQSNLHVVNVRINAPTCDLSTDLDSECSFKNSIYSSSLSVLGIIDLLLAIVIRINIKLSLFDLSQALWRDLSLALFSSVIVVNAFQLIVLSQDPEQLGKIGSVQANLRK